MTETAPRQSDHRARWNGHVFGLRANADRLIAHLLEFNATSQPPSFNAEKIKAIQCEPLTPADGATICSGRFRQKRCEYG
jgi:hypothetical protein